MIIKVPVRYNFLVGLLTLFIHGSLAQTVPLDTNSNVTKQIDASLISQHKWIHGAVDCENSTDPGLEVFRFSDSSYIIRQNKCLSYEAPFIYLLFGEDRALILDTGTTDNTVDFPLFSTVESLMRDRAAHVGKKTSELIVIHSHSHSDHYAGDSQFVGKENVTVIKPNSQAVQQYFSLDQWPQGEASIELGDRELIVIPTPGHQEEAISVYDPQTKWLLTGDTFYPGYLVIKHWDEYKNSIARLVSFSKNHEVSAVLGAHVEMTNQAGKFYPIGTIYQPNEAALALGPENLITLNSAIKDSDGPTFIILDKFVVAPMNRFQKTLSNFARWITQ